MKYAIIFAISIATTCFGVTASAGTLDFVKAKGFVRCGVSEGLAGFSDRDRNGNWSGIDVDICRAVAAAILGDPDLVSYTPLTARKRFEALLTRRIDVLSRNTTWTLSRDTKGLEFAAVSYFDGQAFMVREDLGVKSALELDGAAICVTAGTTTEINLADYFRANSMVYRAVGFSTYGEMVAAYEAGDCDAYTADQSALFGHRTKLRTPNAHMTLPELISKEPLGPVVRDDECDNRWVEVIRWTLYTMLEAEERGIDSGNVDDLRKNSRNPGVRRLLGVEGETGKNLGLPSDWGYKIIKLVGNYAEIFDRNLGPGTPFNIPRGLNALWKDGGIQYAMPVL
jgi:general L-amino acid transport system substrate-binding protein